MSRCQHYAFISFIISLLLVLPACGNNQESGSEDAPIITADPVINDDAEGIICVDEDADGFTIETNSEGSSGTATIIRAAVNCTLVDDCDDTDKNVFPGAMEIIGDGIDQNCDDSDAEINGEDDWDGDKISNDEDNCFYVENFYQLDADNDGTGDDCDTFPNDANETLDADQDGIGNNADNCLSTPNADQADDDADDVGNACDTNIDDDDNPDVDDGDITDNDADNDGVNDTDDNCPSDYNPAQTDADSNGTGDDCESPVTPTSDRDGDGFADDVDNCPDNANPAQYDRDGDGIGNSCDTSNDTDNDGDGIRNADDNCPDISNVQQNDSDGDGIGNICDNCKDVSNVRQNDADGDGSGNSCDDDDDNDGLIDTLDICSKDADEWLLVPAWWIGVDTDGIADGDGIDNFTEQLNACIFFQGLFGNPGCSYFEGDLDAMTREQMMTAENSDDPSPLGDLYDDGELVSMETIIDWELDSEVSKFFSGTFQFDSDGDGIGNSCDDN